MINLREKVYIFLYCLTLENGTDILCRNVDNYHSMLREIRQERSSR
jgi:hypothetical protein